MQHTRHHRGRRATALNAQRGDPFSESHSEHSVERRHHRHFQHLLEFR